MISLNGNKVVDFFSIGRLLRSTHNICLNCGNCAECYSQRYCIFCFERNNWGEFINYLDTLKERYPSFFDKIPDENIKKLLESQKIHAKSFYAMFWNFYNICYDNILNVYDWCFKPKYSLT